MNYITIIYLRAVIFLFAIVTLGMTGRQELYARATEGCKALDASCRSDELYLSEEFTIDGPGIVKAYTTAGDIEVLKREGSKKIRVELYLQRGYAFWSDNNNLDNYRIRLLKRGNEVIASVEMKKKKTGFFSDRTRFSFKIYVPDSMSTELKTSHGNIVLDGLKGDHLVKLSAGNVKASNLSGMQRLYTTGGNIEIEDSHGTIYAKTTAGNIISRNNSGEMRFQVAAGDVTAEQISGTLLVDLQAGNIKAHITRLERGVDLKTTVGNIQLELPGKQGYDLFLSGKSVSVPSNVPFEGSIYKQKVNGQINQGGLPVNMSTSTGNVVLKFN